MLEKLVVTKEKLKPEDYAVIAQHAGKYKSDVRIIKNNVNVNAKSIMGLISLVIGAGDEVYLSASGTDEENCAADLKALFGRL